MKVSVITPIYNHNIQYVRQCLESLRAQTLQEIEFILIDNGANQESKDLIDEFVKNDPRFKAIHFKKNAGYGKAMNAGLDAACGEYIGIVESDDFVDSNMYEELYGIAKREHVDLVKTPFYEQKGENSNIRNFYPQDKLNIQLHFYDFPAFTLCHASTWSAIYNREMVNNHSIRYEKSKGSVGQDIAFMLKTYVSAKSIYILDKPFYHYNIDNENSSMRNNKQNLEIGNLIKQYISLERWKMTQSFFNDERIDALFGKRLFFNLSLLQRKYKNLKIVNKIKIINILKRIKVYTYFSQAEIMEYNTMVSCRPLKQFIKSFVFNNLKEKEKTITYILGLPFESKTYNPMRVEHKHFFGIGKTEKERGAKRYYVLGIPVLKKETRKPSAEKGKEPPEEKREEEERMGKCVDILKGELLKMQNDLKLQLAQMMETQYQITWLPNKVASLHQQVFPQFKNTHEGEDIVIVGCGPTLFDYIPLSKAKHISLNRAFRYPDIKFDYAFIWDLPGIAESNDGTVEDFLNYDCTKFLGKFLSEKIPVPVNVNNKRGRLFRCYSTARHYLQRLRFVDDIIHEDLSLFPLADFMSISFAALHFAIWTHPRRIFLVGCDTTENESFDGRQNSYWLDDMLRGYRLFKEFVTTHYPEISIISVNPVGLRGMFHDVYTPSYLNSHPEIKDAEIFPLDSATR